MIKSLNDFQNRIGYSLEELEIVIQNPKDNYYHFTKKSVKPNGIIKFRPISPSKTR